MQEEDVYTSIGALTRLRHAAHGFSLLPRQPLHSLLSGRGRSRLRGRGLDFDELRHYRPGDDIRSMDWRVTRRTGKPHVRAYTEERDRPVVLVVDQRLSLFFGSRRKMKSVIAAELAAVVAWRVLSAGDRLGAALFNDLHSSLIRPSRSKQRTLAWLGELVSMNRQLSARSAPSADNGALDRILKQVEQEIAHDGLLVVISDFSGWSGASLAALRRIRRHNDVLCARVHDPLESSIAGADGLLVGDGIHQLELRPRQQSLEERYESHLARQRQALTEDLQRHQIPLLDINTVDEAADQLRAQLGGLEARR